MDKNQSKSVEGSDIQRDETDDEGDDEAEGGRRPNKVESIVFYEWEEELDEYDEPDVYPSEKDYKWFDETVTDNEEEEGKEAEDTPRFASDKEEKEQAADEEGDEQQEGAAKEPKKEKEGDAAAPAAAAAAPAAGEETSAGEEDEEQFIPNQMDEEEAEDAAEQPVKKYKTIRVRRLVERPPKIHYKPEHERIEYTAGSDFTPRPFHFLYSFGYDCQRMANLHVLDEETVVFMSGFVLTFYNHVHSRKTYLRALGGSCFGALAVHPSRRLFAAAEKGERPLIGIWSWNKLQLFRKLQEGTEKTYASVTFSPDGKLLASQGGEPDFLITVWNWLAEMPVLRVKSHAQDVYRVTFSKELAGLLTTSGLCHIKFWKMAQTFTGLKLKGDIGRFGRTELSDIEGYVEMPDGKVVSGTEWGNLLVWEDGLVVAELCVSIDTPCHKGIVRFITIVDGDFYTTGQDGTVHVWSFETVDTADIYTTEDSLKVPTKSIANLSVSEDADIWHIVQDPFNQDPVSVFWFAQDGKGIIWKVDLSFLNTAKEPQPILLSHGGPIVACATSPMTYLMATLGVDGKINVYDYITRTLVASRVFNAPGSCMLWPSYGVDKSCCTLLCGFHDGVLRVLVISEWEKDERPSDGLPLQIILHRVWKPHRRGITCLVMDTVADLLVSGSLDGTIFLFNVKDDFAPLMSVSLPEYIPIYFVRWGRMRDGDSGRKIIAVCDKSTVTQIQIPNVFGFDNKVSFCNQDTKIITFLHVNSVKSVLRHNEEQERIREMEEEKQAALEQELRRLVEENIESQSQQDIRRLMEAEALEKEMANKPKPREGKWEPYIPSTPSPILEVVSDTQDPEILNVTLGSYDTGYMYSVKLLPVDKDESAWHQDPVNAIPIQDCNDEAVTKIIFTKNGEKAIMGFQNGQLRMVKLGLPYDIKTMKEHWTEGIHDVIRGSITSLALDFDEMFIFTTGNDGNCFMFSTTTEIKAEIYIASVGELDVPVSKVRDMVDIVDEDDYTLEDSKNFAKEMAIMAAARKNKAAKREEIARLRMLFSEIARRNLELPEDVRLTPIEFQMAKDNVERHEETMKESLEQLHKEIAWESERATIALAKLREFYKDPINCELFVLKSFNSPMKVTSFRHTNLPEFFNDAWKVFLSQSSRKQSQLDAYQEAASDMSLAESPLEPRPLKKPGMDKFQYKRAVRLWRRRIKKQRRTKHWERFLRTDPSGKELEYETDMIQEARSAIGDLKLKTHADYKAPDHLRLTVNKARKRLIDLEATLYDKKGSFNEEMMQLRTYKIEYIDKMKEFRSQLLAAQNDLPPEMHHAFPDIPEMSPEENPDNTFSYSKEEITAFKIKEQAKAELANTDKTGKGKKGEIPKRRPVRPIVPGQQQGEKKAQLSAEKDIGSFVQVIKFPPSPLEMELERIKVLKAKFNQDLYIDLIQKEKHKFDTELKLLRHKKIKLDYYVKTAQTTMVLLTEEFLQAQKGEDVESKLEGIIMDAKKEQKTCTLSLKTINKQIEFKKKEMEEINAQRTVLLSEIKEIAQKVPHYENYLIKVFKKKIIKPKVTAKKGDDDDELEEASYDSDDSDDSDDLDMDADDDDDDLDVDMPPQDLKMDIYEAVLEVRSRRGVVDDQEEVVRGAADELAHQASGFKSRLTTADKTLARSQADLDAFIFDKQNKLNSIDFAVSVQLHQILHFGPNLNEALFTTESIIQRLRKRIPELKLEKKDQKKMMAQTRKAFSHLQVTRQKFLDRLARMSKRCDDEMIQKFGRVRPVEELEEFQLPHEIEVLRQKLTTVHESGWEEEKKLNTERYNLWCKQYQFQEDAANIIMVHAELTEELLKMNSKIENTMSDLTAPNATSYYKEDIEKLKELVMKQWKSLTQLQMEIASLTWRPGKSVIPPINAGGVKVQTDDGMAAAD